MGMAADMAADVRRDSWLVALEGVIAIVFGVLAIAWPGLTVLVLAVLFAFYVLGDRAVTLAPAGRFGVARPRIVGPVLIWVDLNTAGDGPLVGSARTPLCLVLPVGDCA